MKTWVKWTLIAAIPGSALIAAAFLLRKWLKEYEARW